MSRLALLALVMATLAGCGTAPAGAPSATSTDSSSSTSIDDSAPDFTLSLGDGGRFTLSQENRPVFLVFWAEW
jgi:hypothetical protein